MQVNDELIEFAYNLELLLKNKIDPDVFREKYRNRSLDPTIGTIMVNVEHFLSDGDIRLKDSYYKKMQETEMQKLIDLIKTGGSIEEIRKIHFLGSTKP